MPSWHMGNEGVLTPLFHSFTFERIRLASLMLTDGVLAGVFQVRALRFKDRQMNTGQVYLLSCDLANPVVGRGLSTTD